MLMDLLHEVIAAVVAFLILGAGFVIWRLLRRAPFVMVGLGTAALSVGVVLVFALKGMNLRTEGSPAGLVIFAVLGSVALAAGVVGLGMMLRGFVDAGNASAGQVAGAFLSMALVAIGAGNYVVNKSDGRGTRRSVDTPGEGPTRKPLGIAETATQRSVEAGDAYALSWQARGGAPALALRIPALRFESNGLKIPETQDGPRNVVLLAEAPSGLATVTLYRDDSQLDDAAHVSLYGKPRRDDSEPHFVHLEEEPGAWRLLGFECPARMGDYPDLWREAALGCSKPAGFFARHMPSVFGPPRSPIDVRPATGRSGECRMTFLYRGRPAQVRARGKCFTEPTLDALDASARLLARMERERTAPLAPERLAHLDSATALCERMRDLDTCRYTLRFVNVELQAQPAAALKSIIRIVETGSLGRGAERVAWLRTAQQALGDAGARDSRESVHVHVLVLEHGAPNASERLDSLSVLMRLAPQVLQPSDPLTSRTVAILKAERLHPTEEPMRLAALEALAAKSGGR